MPILPLSHPEPFAAVLGVMLHPLEEDQTKAEAFASQLYLSLSLATSAFMNWYNSRIALVDR